MSPFFGSSLSKCTVLGTWWHLINLIRVRFEKMSHSSASWPFPDNWSCDCQAPNRNSKLFLIDIFLKCIWHFQKFWIPICHTELCSFTITQRCHSEDPLASWAVSQLCMWFRSFWLLPQGHAMSPVILLRGLASASPECRLQPFPFRVPYFFCWGSGSQIVRGLQKTLPAYRLDARLHLRNRVNKAWHWSWQA